METSGKPQSFYAPKKLSSKPPDDRLRTMEQQILGEVKLSLENKRQRIGPTPVNRYGEFEEELKNGLGFEELVRQGDEKEKDNLADWKKKCKQKIPQNTTFK